MDFVGPLTTRNGSKYLLTAVDHFTKYAEAYIVPDTTAETVSRCLALKYIPVHGVPDRLVTNRGTAFTSALIQSLCQTWGTRKIQTTAYHPQSNGVCERFHRTLANIVAKVARTTRQWETAIPVALAAYRATPHSSTGYSPNFLTYGREVRLPNSAEWHTDEGICDPLARLTEVRTLAARCLHKEWELQAQRINQRRTPRSFSAGDWVYLRQMQPTPSERKKFWSLWTGPWTVQEQISDVTYKITDITGRQTQVVHINRLKPAGEQGIPDDAFVTMTPTGNPLPDVSQPPVPPASVEREDNVEWEMDDSENPVTAPAKPNNAQNNLDPSDQPTPYQTIVETNLTPSEPNPVCAKRYTRRPRPSIDYHTLHLKGTS